MILFRYLLFGVLGLFAVSYPAQANLTDYLFAQTTGTPTDMTGATTVIGANLNDNSSGVLNIGFPFVFDGTPYTQFSVNANGWMKLGSVPMPTSLTYNNDFNPSTTSFYPIIAPLWDDHQTYQGTTAFTEVGYVKYKVSGISPSRTLTVEWRVRSRANSTTGPYVFQARLHEFDSRIEFIYVSASNIYSSMTASIGLSDASTDYLSLTPGNPATVSSTKENLSIKTIPVGTMYSFYVCPAVDFIGDETQGGTASMASGDVLFKGRKISLQNSVTLEPFSIMNSTTNTPFPVRSNVRVELIDPTGYFQLEGGAINRVLLPGEGVTPRISFTSSTGYGVKGATLVVTTGCGEMRTYNLEYIIDAPAGEFTSGPNHLGPNADLFPDVPACVGDESLVTPINVRNVGVGNLIVHNASAFETDTAMTDGTGHFILVEDQWGNLVRTYDYYLSRSPGAGPITGDTGIVIPEGTSMRLYLNFKTANPGRRTGRIWMRTNATNVSGTDTNGASVTGLIWFDVFGRGVSAAFAGPEGARQPAAMVMEPIKVGASILDTFDFINGGSCNLRIRRNTFRFETGDVREFEVVGQIIDAPVSGNDFVLPPGDTGKVIVRFTPTRSGSRRATMRLVTNDSALAMPGLTERGVFYWEAYGEGRSGLEADDVKLTPAVIDAESSTGVVVIANEQTETVGVDSIRIVGGSGEIMEDPANRWPRTPFGVQPGVKIGLGIHFVPAPGSEDGERVATVLVYLSNGDTVRAKVAGYAGSRKLLVAPTDLFEGTTLKTGEILRRFFTVTNTGTLPVTITSMDLTGDGAADYTLSPLRRATLLPGRTEYIEVTYAPSDANPDDAAITIVSNATNGDQVITLSGDGMEAGTARDDDGGATRGISGVEMEVVSGGLSLGQSMPNPARGATEIRYRVAKEGEVRLALYDGQGRLVRVLDAGRRVAGEHVVRVEVKDLSSGEYHYRLEQGSDVLTRRMVVTH